MIHHLDLFSGIGGFALAARRVGWDTRAFCEIEPFAQRVLRKHWPETYIHEDVRTLRYTRQGDEPDDWMLYDEKADHEIVRGTIDVISAGFPCQDVSVGHTWREARGLAGERSGLWSEVVRLTDEIRPQRVVAENVAALRTRGLSTCLRDLWSVGYDAEWHIIPAFAVGAVHQRERVFIIANPAGQRMERMWPEGFEITRPLDAELLPVRDSDGQWQIEPDILRTDNGVSGRVDRLKAVGNAIVPAVAQRIFEQIDQDIAAVSRGTSPPI